MNRHYKFISTLVILLATVLFSAYEAETKSGGSPLANTGSVGDGASNTCAKIGCHDDFAINQFSGSVTLDLSGIPAGGYVPGQTYTIGVKVAESNKFTFGFQATAEDDSGNKMGKLIASNNKVRLEFTDWVTHAFSSSTGDWTFEWTAPSSTSDVTFYAAGNAANSNGAPTGDHIYSSSSTVSRDLISSVAVRQEQQDIKSYVVLSEQALYVISENALQFSVFSSDGRLVKEFTTEPGTSIEDVSLLQSGMYIIAEKNGAHFNRVIIP